MLVRDSEVLTGLEVKDSVKDFTVSITREEYYEYMMLRLMLADAISNMRMTDDGEAYMIYSVPKDIAEKIMPAEFQAKMDELIIAYEFKKNQNTEEAE